MTQELTISQLEIASETDGSYSGVSNLYYTGAEEVQFSDFRKRVLDHDDAIYQDLFGGKVFIL